MNKNNNKIQLLGTAPVSKALMALGIPAMTGMMINALYNLADAYFVGGLGTCQLGAITVAFPVGQAVVGLGLLFGNGAASYLSRLLGQGERQKADNVASTALYSSLASGILLILLCMCFLTPLLRLLGATAGIMPYALTYTRIFILSSILNVFNVTMNNIVTSEGAAKTTMMALMSGAVLNIILDPILIYGLKMGVAGAAIATAVSQLLSTMIYLRYILLKKSMFTFNIKNFKFSGEIYSEIMKIGVPTLIFQLLISISVTLVNMQAKNYGDSAIAAMGAVTRVISMGSLIVFGFIKGFQPIAGYSYGAGKYDRLQEAIKLSTIWSSIFCAVYGLCMTVFATFIIAAFTKGDSEMLVIGEKALRINGLSFLLFGFSTVYSSLFLSLGKAKAGFFLGALRQGICFIPVILTLPYVYGISGIIYAQPISDLLTGAITLIFAVRFHKSLTAKFELSRQGA